MTPTVLSPGSRAEAAETFGDGDGVVVAAGATIVLPELTYRRLRPERVLLLHRAGLDHGDGRTFGATATLAALVERAPEPLSSAARIADGEVRAVATLGGNLCARGDLEAALRVLRARVRSTGPGGERVEPVESFLATSEPRLVLEVEVEQPLAAGYVDQRRRHAHTYSVLTVAAARHADGVCVAVGGGPPGRGATRCPGVERALAAGASRSEAAAAVVGDVEPHDDALASAWYRRRVLPALTERALEGV